ncbi:MAG: RAD55 family ATPase [Candidatus Bathyarchaeia archaeon]
MFMRLVTTGISNLDHLLGGGVFKGSTVLLLGPVGSGKSYVVQHFICSWLKAGERCLYIATLEGQSNFEDAVKLNFGWGLKPFLRSGRLRFEELRDFWTIEPSQSTFERLKEKVSSAVGESRDAGIVVNNASHLFNFSRDPQSVVRMIASLKFNAEKLGSTLLLVMDKGCVDAILEENIKTLSEYALETAFRHNRERVIRVSKSIVRHGLEWHRLRVSTGEVDVELVH